MRQGRFRIAPGLLAGHVALATTSFAACFLAWGMISAFATSFQAELGLSVSQRAVLIAVPVVLGALARVPVGMMADRLGGRRVMTGVLVVSALAVLAVPWAATFGQLLFVALLLGLSGASFAAGVGYVAGWAGPERQGAALGIYGVGNIGQSAAVFFGPVVALSLGRDAVFQVTGVLLLVWAVVFWSLAGDGPAPAKPKSLPEMLGLLARERRAWVLSASYFLTFGGFVALAIYLPSLLQDLFALTAEEAGFRAGGFVVLATLARPVGGWMADRMGGAQLLSLVFLGLVPFALLLAWPAMLPFTVGALGCAVLLGLGNGAVFKLVPQYFPADAGTITGLVGAVGGLGGILPPLLLGLLSDTIGDIWPGFVLLALISLGLWLLNALTLHREATETGDGLLDLGSQGASIRAGAWASLITGLLIAAIVVGSRNLQNFDPALAVYTFAVIFATWGITYHYYVWLQKPPTQLYWRRGWQLLLQRGLGPNLLALGRVAVTHLAAQRFIKHRSPLRWVAHQLLFWGCLLAVAITFPLVFGWIHFTSAPDDQMIYQSHVFGFTVASFRIRTLLSWLIFHGLDLAAVMVLGGLSLFLWRRMRDQGARAVQSGYDFVPLVLLFAISVTGLALTASSLWLRGHSYGFLAILHAITVIAGLLYLPFGKFFHIFQRPAQLGVKLYQAEGAAGPQVDCARCRQPFVSQLQFDDLGGVLTQLGFDYRLDGGGEGSWQGLCPACKRCSLAAAQLRLKESSDG